jgi:hypothetical protein
MARPSHPSLLQPWDHADDEHTSVACVANSSIATANNTALLHKDKGNDKIESNQNTNQLGIKSQHNNLL